MNRTRWHYKKSFINADFNGVGCVFQERPKSAVFPAEVKSKMSVEEQNERIRRNQSSSVRDKRRSLNLSSNQHIDGFKTSTNYRVVSVMLLNIMSDELKG